MIARNAIQPELFYVYLSVYRGNKLPLFYIGSTSGNKLLRGYVGSVFSLRYRESWRKERLEHPELFSTYAVCEFQDRKEAYDKERTLQYALRVKDNPLYTNLSYGHKDTAGGWNKGLPSWNRGLKFSEETCKRISEAKKNLSTETRLRISAAAIGKNMGELNPAKRAEVRAKIALSKAGTTPICAGWSKGRTGVYTPEARARMSAIATGRKNPKLLAFNLARKGVPRRKRGESDESLALRKQAALFATLQNGETSDGCQCGVHTQ